MHINLIDQWPVKTKFGSTALFAMESDREHINRKQRQVSSAADTQNADTLVHTSRITASFINNFLLHFSVSKAWVFELLIGFHLISGVRTLVISIYLLLPPVCWGRLPCIGLTCIDIDTSHFHVFTAQNAQTSLYTLITEITSRLMQSTDAIFLAPFGSQMNILCYNLDFFHLSTMVSTNVLCSTQAIVNRELSEFRRIILLGNEIFVLYRK